MYNIVRILSQVKSNYVMKQKKAELWKVPYNFCHYHGLNINICTHI